MNKRCLFVKTVVVLGYAHGCKSVLSIQQGVGGVVGSVVVVLGGWGVSPTTTLVWGGQNFFWLILPVVICLCQRLSHARAQCSCFIYDGRTAQSSLQELDTYWVVI